MPKTKKPFDWEVINQETGEVEDVITLTMRGAEELKKEFPDIILKRIGYHADGEDDLWKA